MKYKSQDHGGMLKIIKNQVEKYGKKEIYLCASGHMLKTLTHH